MSEPSTPVFRFPLEKKSQPPGHTLRTDDTFSPTTLGEAVEDELVKMATDISDLQAQVRHGWRPIDSGTHSGPAFIVDITQGGQFPAGTFSMLRVHMRGQLEESAWPTLSVNQLGTGNQHRRGWIVSRASDGEVTESGFGDANSWRVGNWTSAITGNTLTAHLYGTNQSAFVSFDSRSARQSGFGNTALEGRFWGRYNSNILVHALRIGTAAPSTNFASLSWWVEGYRP